MRTTVIQECHACGEDIHNFEPYVEKAIIEHINPDQPERTLLGRIPVLVGRNFYHKICEP